MERQPPDFMGDKLAEVDKPGDAERAATLIEANLSLKARTKEIFDCDWDSLSPAAQYYLSRFITSDRFNSRVMRSRILRFLVATRGRLGLKHQLVESFAALEHGDEFGDHLLTIAEKLPLASTEPVLEQLRQLRRLGSLLKERFTAFDPAVAQALQTASTKRITEVLAVLEDIAVSGQTTVALLGDRQLTLTDPHEIIAVLRTLTRALTAIVESFEAPGRQIIDQDGMEIYQITTPHGGVTLQLRAVGAPLASQTPWEYDTEARINWLISPTSQEPPAPEINHPDRQQALSIRLDREVLSQEEDGTVVKQDPTDPIGQVSLDLGGLFGEESNWNVRVGQILAAGNVIRNRQRGTPPTFHHVREAFEPAWGNADAFSRLVRWVSSQYRENSPDQPPLKSADDLQPIYD